MFALLVFRCPVLDDQLKDFQRAYEYVDVMLANPHGQIVYNTNDSHIETDIDNSFYDINAKAFIEGRKDVYFSEVYKSPFAGYKYGMFITAPIHNLENKFVGVIALEVDMGHVYELILDRTWLGATGETLIGKCVDNKAVFLHPLRHDENAAFNRFAFFKNKTALPIKEAVHGRTGHGLSIDYRGQQIIAAWRNIKVMDWGLVAKIDTNEAFAPVQKLKLMVLAITIVVFVVAISILYFFTRSIIKPVINLSNIAYKITKGDLNHKIEVKTFDEIGYLSDSFNKMIASLMEFRSNSEIANKKITEKNNDLQSLVNQLKESQSMLVQSEKMSAVGTLAAGIAHELNNPLMVIINFVQYCIKHTPSSDKKSSILKDVELEAKRCSDIVSNLLTFSRTGRDEDGVFEKANCPEILNRVFRLLDYRIENENIYVQKNYNGDMPDIQANINNIQQLFLNILTNAFDALDGADKKEVNIMIKNDRENVYITISDTGPGIGPDIIENIFDPFFTTKAVGEGTGLGLSICNNIVNEHNGKITCKSIPDKGATFNIQLPRY